MSWRSIRLRSPPSRKFSVLQQYKTLLQLSCKGAQIWCWFRGEAEISPTRLRIHSCKLASLYDPHQGQGSQHQPKLCICPNNQTKDDFCTRTRIRTLPPLLYKIRVGDFHARKVCLWCQHLFGPLLRAKVPQKHTDKDFATPLLLLLSTSTFQLDDVCTQWMKEKSQAIPIKVKLTGKMTNIASPLQKSTQLTVLQLLSTAATRTIDNYIVRREESFQTE